MRAKEFTPGKETKERFVEMFGKFLPLAMKYLELKRLPKIVFQHSIHDEQQPTFGRYVNDENTLYVALSNRHPVDILRTTAHELQHFKQDTEHKLNVDSGRTGSPEENEAHAMAGIVMRHFNKLYPEYLSDKPVISEKWTQKYKKSINCSNPKGFSQRAHCQGRKKHNEGLLEKLNRTGSNELVIFDIDDTLLHTTAKINVMKDGKVIRSLTNQEFNNYKLGTGEEFDFGEFRDAKKFEEESVPIGPMLEKLRSDLATGKNVVMLTARSDFNNQPAVWRTFKRHGIDINKDVHLFRAGNLPGDGSPAVKKAIHVSEWLKSGQYNKVVMYDDSEKNLAVFKSLEKRFPDVDFEAHHVSEEGNTRQVESQNEDLLAELNVAQTLKFIKQAHGDQLYGSLPYWTHPKAVALTGRKIFGSRFNSNAIKTAFLHDVVEDTHIGLDELSKLGFDVKVIDAVSLLTKNKTLNYRQNIERIIASGNLLAMMVKYADNYENFTGDKSGWDPERASHSQKKYLMSLNMLGDKLGVKHHIGENFADGRNPQDKGDSKRYNVPTKGSISSLRKIAKQGGRRGQLAHWMANMRSGKSKKK